MFTHEVQLSLNSKTAVLDIWKQNGWMLRLLCSGWLFWWELVHTWVHLGPHSSKRGGVSLGARETPVPAQREREDAILVTFQTLSTKGWCCGMCSEPGPLSPSYLVFPKCFVVTLTVASNDLTSQIGLTAFFLRLDSVEIAPLQHKGRPNLPFSPPWWLHGEEVWLYLRPAVTLAQHGGLSYTGSMSIWQGQLTSFQLASNVLQENVRKVLPLSLPAHPLFMLQPWNVVCGLCGCEGVSTI